jgi:phosphoribosylformylglycinamidine synthase
MGQFADAIAGMGEACRALDFPIVSGNVSLYNETRQPDGSTVSILPTPAIGGLGVLEDAGQAIGMGLKPELDLVLLGRTEGALGQSLWLREIHGREDGAPPPLDLAAERRTGDFVRARILSGAVAACHDLSDGGLLVGIAEMAMAGGTGCKLDVPQSGISPHAYWFGEDQGRYLLAVADGAALVDAARRSGIEGRLLGRTGGDGLTLPSGATISLARLRQAHGAFFPALMDR